MRRFKTGDRVLVTTRPGGSTKKQYVGVFQLMQTKTRALVFVDPKKADDDGMRLVALTSLAPYYDDPTDRARRAKHAMRLFKQGIRWFRYGGPKGTSFNAVQMDIVQGDAFGSKKGRKTILQVPIHDLWPESYR